MAILTLSQRVFSMNCTQGKQPIFLGNTNGGTGTNSLDVDNNGNVIIGGTTNDMSILSFNTSTSYPFLLMISA